MRGCVTERFGDYEDGFLPPSVQPPSPVPASPPAPSAAPSTSAQFACTRGRYFIFLLFFKFINQKSHRD